MWGIIPFDMIQMAAYVALIAAIVAPGEEFRTAWRAALHSAAVVFLFALIAPA